MNGDWYRWQDDTLFLNIRLHPGAKINKVNALLDSRLRINIKSPPVNGMANKELITMLARDFGTKKAQIRIGSGALGRDKLIEVHTPAKYPKWFIDLIGKNESC